MTSLLRISMLSLLLAVIPGAAHAFDQVVHYSVIYAAAVANGFSADDAALIANASYSLDDNDTTTAFSLPLVASEITTLPSRPDELAELPHMRSGQVFHALTSSTNREIIEQGHLERIKRVLNDPREPGTPAQKRKRALLYFGEYMHFVADLVVHPNDPFLGHAEEGHTPDRGDLNPDAIRIALGIVSKKMSDFRDQKPLEPTRHEDLTRIPDRIGNTPDAGRVLGEVVRTVRDSWTRTYPASAPNASALFEAAGGNVRLLDTLEKERTARAASEIARVLDKNNLHYQVYHKIQLDSDGEAVGVCTRSTDSACNPAIAQDTFGNPRRIDVLPFATTLANRPALRADRKQSVLVATARGTVATTISPMSDAARDLTEHTINEIRKASTWLPPSTPGGVALNPRLSIPLGEIGTPKKIVRENDDLFLVTTSGRYEFEGISARSFATIARTVAVGQVPYITIGSEPSARPGYAKVTYSPALVGTAEGLSLYHADIQFKRIFAKLPFSDAEIQHGIDVSLFANFPGSAGDLLRFWITSQNISLAVDGSRLVPRQHGMRVLSETRLRFNVQSDPEMEAYAENLTRRWNDIAEHLWPFRAVELLARTTAIVFWARDHGVEIDPEILLLPVRVAITPEYAPLVAAIDTDRTIAGGVALTPEDKRTTVGRAFLSYIAHMMSDGGGLLGVLLLGASLAVPSIFGGAFVLWLLMRMAAPGHPPRRVGYRHALLVWSALCGAQILLVGMLSPLIAGDVLSFFDRDLLAMMATLVAFPVALFATLRFVTARDVFRSRHGLRYAVLALGLAGPVAAGAAGIALACFTAALTGPVPTTALNELLTAELAVSEAVPQGLLTVSVKPDGRRSIYPVPRSLMEAFRPQYEGPIVPPTSGASEVITSDAKPDLTMPWQSLKQIHWPPSTARSDVVHYSADGEPPF
jgi:hypothetical protein